MGKTFKIGSITKEQQIKIERSAKRLADIENGITNFKHKIHASSKNYNRQKTKKVEW